jgi:glycosyltransferase involved in cell wall biosynthesis
MRAIFVLHDRLDPNAGGGGTVAGLGAQLAGRGHEIEYCSFDLLPERLSHNAKTILWPAYLAGRLGRSVRRDPPDVVDASVGDAWLWQRLDRRRSRRALVIARSHGLIHLNHEAELLEVAAGRKELSWRYPFYWGGYRLWEVATSLRQADMALFLNPLEREYAIERLGVDESRTRIVPNGIPDRFLAAPAAPAPLGAEEAIGIAQVGGWRYLKGINHSVEALTEVLARHRSAFASFVGTGVAEAEVLTRFPPELHSRIRVIPSYERESLPEQVRGHHVTLFPSLAEGFGLGLLEAMACGLAPVATTAGGPGMLVSDGENGLSVHPGDTAGIVACLERLIADRQLLRRLRDAARESAKPYAFTRVADRTLAVYEEGFARRAEEGVSP